MADVRLYSEDQIGVGVLREVFQQGLQSTKSFMRISCSDSVSQPVYRPIPSIIRAFEYSPVT